MIPEQLSGGVRDPHSLSIQQIPTVSMVSENLERALRLPRLRPARLDAAFLENMTSFGLTLIGTFFILCMRGKSVVSLTQSSSSEATKNGPSPSSTKTNENPTN